MQYPMLWQTLVAMPLSEGQQTSPRVKISVDAIAVQKRKSFANHAAVQAFTAHGLCTA